MRQRFFLIALLAAIVVVTAALAPLSFAIALPRRAGASGRRIGERIARRIREATA